MSSNVEKLQGMKSFNLPAGESCPHKTRQCLLSCYAMKGRFNYPDVKRMYTANMNATHCWCFVERVLDNITYTDSVVRIHASGDFYSKKYFEKWLLIAHATPWVTYYAYTRNWTLDLSKMPRNFIVYYSTDKTTKRENPTAERFARMVDGDKKETKHRTPYKDGMICNSDNCASCGYCFREGGNIYFLQKYKKYTNPDELIQLV